MESHTPIEDEEMNGRSSRIRLTANSQRWRRSSRLLKKVTTITIAWNTLNLNNSSLASHPRSILRVRHPTPSHISMRKKIESSCAKV